jgi:hypothetical protein
MEATRDWRGGLIGLVSCGLTFLRALELSHIDPSGCGRSRNVVSRISFTVLFIEATEPFNNCTTALEISPWVRLYLKAIFGATPLVIFRGQFLPIQRCQGIEDRTRRQEPGVSGVKRGESRYV